MKKQLIMEKALELFAKQGIEGTSVQQITEHSNISKGAFYLSFKSKDALVLALIDHFMEKIIADIDLVVSELEHVENPLYKYYYVTFESFLKHSDFVNILLKEQAYSFSEELLMKMHYYDALTEKLILTMIEKIFGNQVQFIKYDLLYCVKTFSRMYSELFLFQKVPMDLDLLSRSLVEKTNLLAKQTSIPFITEELFSMFKKPLQENVTTEQLHELIDKVIPEMDEENIEKESLLLLKKELEVSSMSRAIVKGLIENISHHPQCKWISYLLRRYFGF
ncbi:TetR/AcrR family transcriptional regulator [Bacillus pinisoli]|uniref:TetR/AcrR family transcriptional regulator n=1 Tax=Bacillus pinisoli TaxID=2901866 RepID=UPI001FF4FF39|nr:TetR/AcrR family transcriptional regulator [Bacillus pinisoli]